MWENVSFGPQKYILLFNMTIYYIKNDIEGKLTPQGCQYGGGRCLGRHFSHFK